MNIIAKMCCERALFMYGPYFGYINKKHSIVIEPKYILARDFSEDVAAVCLEKKHKTSFNLLEDQKWGYIDKNGKTIIPFEFEAAESFKSGYAIVTKENKKCVIDKT